MTPSGRETAGGRAVLLVLLVLVLLVGGGYTAAAVAAGANVPRGTTVSGVDVGGRTPAEAAEALEAGLADRVDEPIPVSVDGETLTVIPADAGLSVDYEASVAAAGGEKSWEPGRLWDYYTGGDDLDAVVSVDEAAMTATVEDLIASAGTLPKDGDIRFQDGAVQVVQPRPGEQVSVGRRTCCAGGGVPPGGRDGRAVADARAARHRQRGHPGGPRRVRQPGRLGAGHPGLRQVTGPAAAAGLRAGARHACRGREAGARARRGEAGRAGRGSREPQRGAGGRELPGGPGEAQGRPGQARGPLPAGGRQRRLPRPRAAAQREARAEGQGHRRRRPTSPPRTRAP